MQEIICVLDKSGSMQSVADDALGGFNEFIKAQQEVDIPANLTMIWFDSHFKVDYTGSLDDAPKIDHWPSGGMTALLDAIGKTFAAVSDRFDREKPEKVILAIMTDGHENASLEFDTKAVEKLITEHQEKYGWEVIFLAADQDAWATARHLGIHEKNAVSYDSLDTRAGFSAYSNSVAASRTR